MIHFLRGEKEYTLSKLQTIYEQIDFKGTFADWVKDTIEHEFITLVDDSLDTKEIYINRKIQKRKDKIKEQVISNFLHPHKGLKSKQRRDLKTAYKKSEQYIKDCQEAYDHDPTLRKLFDPAYAQKLYDLYLQDSNEQLEARAMKALHDFEYQQLQDKLRSLPIQMYMEEHFSTIRDYLQFQFEKALKEKKLYIPEKAFLNSYHNSYRKEELTIRNMGSFFAAFSTDYDDLSDMDEDEVDDWTPCISVIEIIGVDLTVIEYMSKLLMKEEPELSPLLKDETLCEKFQDMYLDELYEYGEELVEDMDLSPLSILKCLMENRRYQRIAFKYYEKRRKQLDRRFVKEAEYRRIKKEKQERENIIKHSILQAIPENYIDLYPNARKMQRHFVLHVGPTNSGKTHDAMMALRQNGNGAYFAPLRLLAYEQFERLNEDGFHCDLVTGEEKTLMPFSTFQSSTIEMADYNKRYSMVVIDEAQMIADSGRGGSWTSAILGLCAQRIHVCMAPYALYIVVRLINECGDSYEVIEHHRDTRLVAEEETFRFPGDVQEKDALIVFSKKNVHAVASELQRRGKRCSIIYGNLPYDVRQEEARKFLTGQTEVIVSTDAIGMGMNLPIRRIVFLETSKYDGKETRPLKAEEIQQIAGRAGRKGIYDIGYMATMANRKLFAKSLNKTIEPIEKAVLKFPESLLGIRANLSEILERWDKMTPNQGYEKGNLGEMISLCRELEHISDNKALIYEFISIPFDSKNATLKSIWIEFFKDELKAKPYNYRKYFPDVYDNTEASYLNELELNYQICDLMYAYMDKFHPEEDFEDITEYKKNISEHILKILEKQKLQSKKCTKCGRTLPWNHTYGMCEHCFYTGRGGSWRRR